MGRGEIEREKGKETERKRDRGGRGDNVDNDLTKVAKHISSSEM